MQKVMKYVEGYVEWLALGLGLLWVLWVGYAYWLSPPTFTTIGQNKYGPSEVDDYIAGEQGPIVKLQRGVKPEGKNPPELVKYFGEPPTYVASLKDKMKLDDFTPPVLARMWPAGLGLVSSTPEKKIEDMILKV